MTNYTSMPEINIEGFQVVSADLFHHSYRVYEPTITIWYTSICFSKAAVTALNTCERIHVEVNAMQKGLLIVPVTASDKNAIKWLKNSKDPMSRRIECRPFTAQLYKLWGFQQDRAYRAKGRLVTVDNKVMILFDFNDPESWLYKGKITDEIHE